MSAAEKLKALDGDKTFNPMHLWNALPQIVAVVEAAEKFDGEAARRWPDSVKTDDELSLRAVLAALDEALT